ncbi:hypothetical protein ACFLR5_00445 [Elusimicrobiota bacterium]
MAIMNIDGVILGAFKNLIPTVIKGFDIGRWLIIGISVFLKAIADYQSEVLRDEIETIYREQNESVSNRSRIKNIPSTLEKLKTRIKRLFIHRKSEVRKLQYIIARAKEKLDKLGKHMTFLSIDVVSSTDMKEGEDKDMIDYYFRMYKEYVQKILKEYDYIKSAWTPDGVMSCFYNFDDALEAAKELLQGLNSFNNRLNLMRHKFAVRCGINSGFIYVDDVTRIEELSDRTIDITAHLQKEAPPNSIYIAKQAVRPISILNELDESIEEIDGCKVCVWKIPQLYQTP